MEFSRKNIHMDRIKSQANSQIVVEEDKNIPELNPDIAYLLTDSGKVVLDLVQPEKGVTLVQGRVCYDLLYLTEEEEAGLYPIHGEIPFEERVFMEGVDLSSQVECDCVLEDLKAVLIHSRKCTIRVILNLEVKEEESYEQEAIMDVIDSEIKMELQKKQMEILALENQRRERITIPSELELPANMPPVGELIWASCVLEEFEWTTGENTIHLQGEEKVHMIYQQEDGETRFYETTLPIHESLACEGVSTDAIVDIIRHKEECNWHLKADYDGEDRILELQLHLEIGMKVYSVKKLDCIMDAYGLGKEVVTIQGEGMCYQLLYKNMTKNKIAGELKCKEGDLGILQICNCQFCPGRVEKSIEENRLVIRGFVKASLLYTTVEKDHPYACLQGKIPFTQEIMVPGITADSCIHVDTSLEQTHASLLDGETVSVKAVVTHKVIVLGKRKEQFLQDLELREGDRRAMEEMPSMVIYRAKDGDTIWNLGKQYGASLDSIRTLNNLTSDTLQEGEKVLLVKELC